MRGVRMSIRVYLRSSAARNPSFARLDSRPQSFAEIIRPRRGTLLLVECPPNHLLQVPRLREQEQFVERGDIQPVEAAKMNPHANGR